MEPKEVKGLLQEKTSAKGNKYLMIEIWITPNYSKKVFLEPAESELIKLALRDE